MMLREDAGTCWWESWIVKKFQSRVDFVPNTEPASIRSYPL
jgi:hypothetical protein